MHEVRPGGGAAPAGAALLAVGLVALAWVGLIVGLVVIAATP